MTDERERSQLRQHLAELRHATRGLGQDFAVELANLDDRITELGKSTAKETKYLVADIQRDLADLSRRVDREIRRLPEHLSTAGAKLGSATVKAASAAKSAAVAAGHVAKEKTKDTLAAAAGVRRSPIKEWHPPERTTLPSEEPSDEPK